MCYGREIHHRVALANERDPVIATRKAEPETGSAATGSNGASVVVFDGSAGKVNDDLKIHHPEGR